MSEHILPLGLAFLLVGALSSGCKGAEADLFPLDAGQGSSGGSGTPGSLTQGASSSGASNPLSTSTGSDGGYDGAAAPDSGEDAQDDRPAQADAPAEGASPVDASPGDDASSASVVAEGGDDAPASSDDASFAPDAGTDGLVCTNLGCIDFFDCAIFHPAEIGPCGFTKCVDLVCQ